MSAENDPYQLIREAFDAKYDAATSSEKRLALLDLIQDFSFRCRQDATIRSPYQSDDVQKGFSNLWGMFFKAAKIVDKDHSFLPRLVLLLVKIQEIDIITQSLAPDEGGMLKWRPYCFAEALQGSMTQSLVCGSSSQQCSLAAFSAQAFAAGVYEDSIGLVALWCLRESLETVDEAKVIQLLPLATTWISHCRHSLLALTVRGQSYEARNLHITPLTVPGVLARRANVYRDGYSMNRWLFWRRRLHTLSRSLDSALSKIAWGGFLDMMDCGRELNIKVHGEADFADAVQRSMDKMPAAIGKRSLKSDDIEINKEWVY